MEIDTANGLSTSRRPDCEPSRVGVEHSDGQAAEPEIENDNCDASKPKRSCPICEHKND